MKTSNHTKGLFWLGVKGRALMFFGGFLCLVGIVIISFSLIGGGFSVGFGIFLFIKGKQDELHYKRKSGYIVYNGN